MIRIKQKTPNVCKHTNGNIVNIVIIASVVHLLKNSCGIDNQMLTQRIHQGRI